MNTLFALVLTIGMTNGDFQDVFLGVYESQQACEAAAVEQKVASECFEIESIDRTGEQPAGYNANL